MLKWKPSEENSVDFMILDVQMNQGGGRPKITIGLWKGGREHSEYGHLHLSEEDAAEFRKHRDKLRGMVVECRFVSFSISSYLRTQI